MDQIPAEIIDAIMQYIPEVKQLGHLTQVNHKFRNIIDKSKVCETLCKHHIFAAKIIEMQSTNKLSWKMNLELINSTVVKSYEIKIQGNSIKTKKTRIIQLKGNGSCYINVYNDRTKKPNYMYNTKPYSIPMYNIVDLNTRFKNQFIIDFTFDVISLDIVNLNNERIHHVF